MRASLLGLLLLSSAAADAATLEVGPGKPYAAPCAAIAAAATGDRIEIDAAGTYSGDVCAWTTSGLTIVGVNGRPKIDANGMSAQGKAIWVVSGDDTTVENVEMSGATVADANGAGIRQEGKNLTVRGCWFHDNQDGILAGDAPGSTILIEASEFAHNGAGDGQSHNLYINHVDKLIFRWNYSHHANVGHLLKSRALVSDIRYNRLSDEADGTASYEINVPNAGTTVIVGNVIEQGPMTMNAAIIDYGSEPTGFNPTQDLYVVNNTIVNDRPAGGTFVQIAAMVTTPAVLTNNIFAGGGTVTTQASAVQTTNYAGASPMFAAPASYDYHLLPGSPCVDAGSSPTATPPGGLSLVPTMEYVHPAMVEGRVTVGVIDIGAYELGGATPLVDGGGAIDLALGPGVDAGDIVTGVGSHGCGCTLGARPPQSGRFLFSLIALISLMLFRFRTNRA
ncbi:MAG TPA: right-handed parallel beta-helix repeat-containing protein [Polyangia bacterium]|nr:right-handed parallel beta-helix repeat-containing protein [Polyangia bacterium]